MADLQGLACLIGSELCCTELCSALRLEPRHLLRVLRLYSLQLHDSLLAFRNRFGECLLLSLHAADTAAGTAAVSGQLQLQGVRPSRQLA